MSTDGKVDRAIRVTGPVSHAAVSLDAAPRGIAHSREAAVGAIYELLLEALYPSVDWLGVFHACAVARGGTALLFPALSGSGKSTLLTSLLHDGYDYLADSLAGVSAGDHRVWPFPLSINLKRGSRDVVAVPRGFEAIDITDAELRTLDILGAELRDQMLAPPSEAWAHSPARLHAVVFPRYVAGAAPALAKVTAVDALVHLLTNRVYLGDSLTARRISRFLRWVEATPFYTLVYGDLAAAKVLIAGLLP
jgi:hypothetical protein